MSLLYFEWVDSSGGDGWVPKGDLNDHIKLSHVRSVGILVYEDDESITVAAGVDDTHGNYHNLLTIPKFAITKREELGGDSGN